MASRTGDPEKYTVSTADVQRLLDRVSGPGAHRERQRRVLCYLCQTGMQNTEMARQLGVEESTINNDVSAFYREVGLTGRGDNETKRRLFTEAVCQPFRQRFIMNQECRQVELHVGPVAPNTPPPVEEKEAPPKEPEPPNQPPPGPGPQVIRVPPRPPVVPWGRLLVAVTLLLCLCSAVGFFLGGLYAPIPGRVALGPTAAPVSPRTTPLVQTVVVYVPAPTLTPAPSASPAASVVITMVVTATPLPSTTLTAPIIGTRVATAIASPTPSLVAISVPTSAAVASETGQQDPPPGTVIAAGKRFTKDGISISVNQGLDLDPSGNGFAPDLVIQNGSGGEILVRWKNSFVHFRDDHGHEYRQWKRAQSDWDKNKQFAMPDGGSTQISPCFVGFLWPNGCYDRDEGFDWFLGRIDPSVSTLSLTIDQIGGMTNLNWVYQLH